MKRNILLFLCAFLATLGVCAGVFLLLKKQADKQADEAARQAAATATTTPEPAPAPEIVEPEPVAEPTPAPAPAPEPAPAPAPAPEVVNPEPAVEPTPAPEPAPAPQPEEIKLKETPRNAEHKSALTAAAVLEANDPAAALQNLLERVRLLGKPPNSWPPGAAGTR